MSRDETDAALQGLEIEGWMIGEKYSMQPRVSRLYYCEPRHPEFLERADAGKCVCKYISPEEGERRMELEYQANRDLQECPYIVRPIYVAAQKYAGGYLIFMHEYQQEDALEYLQKYWIHINTVKAIIRNVCVALAYMHELDYVHRDVKLDNIFLGDGEIPEAFLGDLGFAEQLEGESFTEEWPSTRPYAAPELLKCEPYGKPVDMWAVGVCLYALLTRHYPFGAWEKKNAALRQAYEENAIAGWYDLEGIPEEAHRLVTGLLEVDPSQRMTAKAALRDPFLELPKPNPW